MVPHWLAIDGVQVRHPEEYSDWGVECADCAGVAAPYCGLPRLAARAVWDSRCRPPAAGNASHALVIACACLGLGALSTGPSSGHSPTQQPRPLCTLSRPPLSAAHHPQAMKWPPPASSLQPAIPENTPLERTRIKRPRLDKKTTGAGPAASAPAAAAAAKPAPAAGAAAAAAAEDGGAGGTAAGGGGGGTGGGTTLVRAPVKHVVSQELQLYFDRVARLLRGAQPAAAQQAEPLQRAVLASLACDPGASAASFLFPGVVQLRVWAGGVVRGWSGRAGPTCWHSVIQCMMCVLCWDRGGAGVAEVHRWFCLPRGPGGENGACWARFVL